MWRETGPTLWRAVYAFSGGRRDLTDDAVAEAFARAMRYDGTIREPVPWLYRTAFRLAARELRRNSRVEPLPEVTHEDVGDAADLLKALRRLPEGQRAALFLHYYADLPVKEVARLQGTTAAAVKLRLMRGRRRLGELLGERTSDEA